MHPTRRDPSAPWLLALALLHAALSAAAFAVLAAVFAFPDILREPADVVLAAFAEDATTIRWAYYAFTLASVALVPVALLLRRALGRPESALLAVATAFGVLTAAAQTLGFVRWTILVPFLADAHADPAADPARREAVAVAYEFANRYLGMTVGEHLGWVFQGTWTLLLAVALLRDAAVPRWLGLLGFPIAAALFLGALEQFEFGGEDALAVANALGTTAFPFWLIALAVALLRARPAAPPA